jgi:hypothetical protein
LDHNVSLSWACVVHRALKPINIFRLEKTGLEPTNPAGGGGAKSMGRWMP